MKTLQTYDDLQASDQGAVIALGNFDGLHRGHQAVITQAQSIADEIGAPLVLVCFGLIHIDISNLTRSPSDS